MQLSQKDWGRLSLTGVVLESRRQRPPLTGRRNKDSESKEPEGSKLLESAGDDLAPGAPGERIGDRVGLDAPAAVVGVPARADRPQRAFGVANIEDIRITVGQQVALLAAGLLHDHPIQLSQAGLSHGFTAEFGNDRGIDRCFGQFVDVERSRRARRQGGATEVPEKIRTQPPLDATDRLFITDMIIDHERVSDFRNVDGGDVLQKIGRLRLGFRFDRRT